MLRQCTMESGDYVKDTAHSGGTARLSGTGKIFDCLLTPSTKYAKVANNRLGAKGTRTGVLVAASAIPRFTLSEFLHVSQKIPLQHKWNIRSSRTLMPSIRSYLSHLVDSRNIHSSLIRLRTLVLSSSMLSSCLLLYTCNT